MLELGLLYGGLTVPINFVMADPEIPNWLKGLPLAPEFRPTDTEFADPVAYISKIEKQASAFGICKVIPPCPGLQKNM